MAISGKRTSQLKRLVTLIAGVAMLLAAFWLVKLIWFRPANINHFFERIFIEYALSDPELMSSIRPPFVDRFRDYNGQLTDASPAHAEHLADMVANNLSRLEEYDKDKLDTETRLSYDILHWFLQNQADGRPFLLYDYPLNQLNGVQKELPAFMEAIHQVESKTDAENYVYRLRQFGKKFDQVREGLKKREEAAILPPDFVIRAVLKEMTDFQAQPPDQNILYTSFARKLAAADPTQVNESDQVALLERAEKTIRNDVYPAYQRLIGYCRELIPKLDGRDGVWKLPDGAQFYAWKLRQHTTTDLSADEIHEMGLREVSRLQSEARVVLDSLGYSGESVGEWLRILSRDTAFFYSSDERGMQQCLDDYQAIIDEANLKTEGLFDTRPRAGLSVQRVPAFKQEGEAGAYYMPPALDGTRGGVFYVNLRNMEEIPKWGMRTLAYHEAVPGHHFQIATQQELEDVATFRRVLPFTAYSEGWALYAETLAFEYGLHPDLISTLGYYQAQLFRASRLVVDTGIHSKKWTREQAITYMIAHTGMSDGEVVAEIERYIVDPGQACAYMTGMLKILELREKCKQSLGKHFVIQEFHELVLKNGAMPLEVLEQLVDQYLTEKTSE
jgi:uncharacterized protein (DUF885 family)